MTGTVLVTGACGLVGRATVQRLAEEGRRVVLSDLETPENAATAARLRDLAPDRVRVRWTDLTDPGAVATLVADARPAAVVHLAAVIPPLSYARPAIARAVNVDATGHLLAACAAAETPPRVVLASSVAVHGSRNPHTHDDVLGADTPPAPSDLYGGHKVEAEQLVRGSGLDHVVLRLGGVMTVERAAAGSDSFYLGAALPADGRIQTVDVRDVATAMARATEADVLGRVLMIGGDDATHRLRQHQLTDEMAAAAGLEGGFPPGLPGDPEDDAGWFATDWMDTAPAQAALDFQHHSWPQMLAETRARAGWSRHLLRLVAPVLHEVLRRRSPYYGSDRRYADPWGAVATRWGVTGPDEPSYR